MLFLLIACMPFLSYANDSLLYPSPEFSQTANIRDDSLFRLYREVGYQKFWEIQAQSLPWFKKWDEVLQWNPPYAQWFIGAETNASYVCLDHIVNGGKGNKTALIWEGENGDTRRVSYHELLQKVMECANVLKSLGVQKGDRVAIYMPILPETIISMLACARIGAVHLVIFGGVGEKSIAERINHSEAKIIITADGGYRKGKVFPFKHIATRAVSECPSIQKILIFNRTNETLPVQDTREVLYNTLAPTVSKDIVPEKMEAEDLLFILYTSGTTGKPKGIMHTTGGFLVGVHNTFKWVFDPKDEDIYWCTADMGWITGNSYGVYGPLSNGITQFIYEGAPDYPSKSRVWEMIQKYKISIFYTAPTLIRTFIHWGDHFIKPFNLSSLRILGSIGEPINPDVWKWYREKIGSDIAPIVDTWFQTETGAFVLAPLPGYTPLKPGSVTVPLPGYEAKILDPEGNEVSNGLLAITQPFPSMLRGVYKDADRYQSTYWSKWDGHYYFAGDGASRDEDGYFWIYGRVDDVIKVSGHRIGSAELENATVEHLAIAEAAAVGIPDSIKGEEIYIFAILKHLHTPSKELGQSVIDTVVQSIGAYAKPKKVVFVNQLPKNRSGKILRRVLRNIVLNENLGDLTTIENLDSIEDVKNQVDNS